MNHWSPEWVQVVVAAFALGFAAAAWWTSRTTYKASFQPMLRIVGLGLPDHARDRVALKNLGRGPAFGIVIARGRGENESTLAGEADALEPLDETYGPDFKESSRVGRMVVNIAPSFNVGDSFRVLYQDAEGEWHETRFEIVLFKDRVRLRAGMLGEVIREDVPNWVKERARIVTAWI